MKPTKKAKKINVFRVKCESHYLRFTCPTCLTTFLGEPQSTNIIKFRCVKCGQVLEIGNIEEADHETDTDKQ